MSADGSGSFEADPERVRLLRAVADDIRGRTTSSEGEQLAAIVHRISDLYDADEETSPGDIYRNARFIMQVNERGGLDR
jgi:uncharacterized protein (DUF2267 family)